MLDGVGAANEVVAQVAEFIAREFAYEICQSCTCICERKNSVI